MCERPAAEIAFIDVIERSRKWRRAPSAERPRNSTVYRSAARLQ